MLAILEKHAQRTGVPVPQPKTPEVVADDSTPRMQPDLEWKKPEKGATGVRTVCGRYSCSKVTVNGKTSYEVWRLVPNHWFAPLAMNLDSFETAKRLANEDMRKRQI